MKIALLSSHLAGADETTELGYETQQIQRALKVNGGELLFIDPSKLAYGVKSNIAFAECKTLDGSHLEASDFDVLFIRRTRGLVEQIMDFAEFAERANPALVVADPIASFGRPTSKVESIIRRAAKFPQPDTQVITNSQTLGDGTLFPVIAKPTHGAAGKGVEKCLSKTELHNYLEKIDRDSLYNGYGTLVQQALEIDHEFRVMVVDGRALGCVTKQSIAEKPDVRNAAQGASFTNYEGANREDVMNFAENLSKFLEQDISGVDIIQSAGKLYVIECNRNPQFQEFDFATQSRTAEAIVQMLHEKVQLSAGTQIEKPQEVAHHTKVFPRIFVGCSSEGLSVAEELQYGLSNCSDTVLWNQGTFEPGEHGLASLDKALHKYDYAVFCITPDDLTKLRGNEVFEPRDNVVFEAGLFMGRLGLDRVLLVVNRNDWPSLPSDLKGVTVVTWRDFADGDLRPALAPAILDIRRRLRLQ